MAKNLDLKSDHVHGGFAWETPPSCTCGLFAKAIEEKWIFVSNWSDHGVSIFYIMPLDSDGELARSDGINLTHCPWCGDEIKAHKKFPTPAAS